MVECTKDEIEKKSKKKEINLPKARTTIRMIE